MDSKENKLTKEDEGKFFLSERRGPCLTEHWDKAIFDVKKVYEKVSLCRVMIYKMVNNKVTDSSMEIIGKQRGEDVVIEIDRLTALIKYELKDIE